MRFEDNIKFGTTTDMNYPFKDVYFFIKYT